MKKIALLFLLIVLNLNLLSAQSYRVSLLTCDPGDELYSIFGHSAVRVVDLNSGRDLVFNYGTFDFDTPNFYLKFANGKLDYMLSVSTYDQFIEHYTYLERAVREQVLDLNEQQAAKAVEFLQINYQPDNRYYRYDFFYDNCATRIRDMMEIVLGDQLEWKDPLETEDKTFRNLIDEYVYPLPWGDLGIDLALGSVIDVDATEREKQFLPDYMEAAFARAEIVGDGPSRPLVKSQTTVLDLPPVDISWSLINPYFLFWGVAILFITITYFGFKRKKLYLGLDQALFGILSLVGIIVVLLWFFTEHTTTKFNWNLLWAFPLHGILVFGLAQKTPPEWLKKYLLFALILADAAIVFWILGWQSFHPSVLPLILVVILRTNYLYYNLERLKSHRRNVPV
ncbi:Lnb N-terminal periplasmic domain-containing protein [Echinicola sediminis]